MGRTNLFALHLTCIATGYGAGFVSGIVLTGNLFAGLVLGACGGVSGIPVGFVAMGIGAIGNIGAPEEDENVSTQNSWISSDKEYAQKIAQLKRPPPKVIEYKRVVGWISSDHEYEQKISLLKKHY